MNTTTAPQIGDTVAVVIHGMVVWTGEVAYTRGDEVGIRDFEPSPWGGHRTDEVKAEHVVVIG